MAAVDTPANGRDAGHENNPAPMVGRHGRHAELRQDEAGPQVDAEHLVKLGDGNVHEVADASAVAGIGYQGVWVSPVLGHDLVKEPVEVGFLADVQPVCGAFLAAVGRGELCDQGVDWGRVGIVREDQVCALGVQSAGTC